MRAHAILRMHVGRKGKPINDFVEEFSIKGN